jgi:hypothetical protein
LTIVPRRRPLDHVQALQAESLGFLLVRAGQLWSERVLAIVNAEAGAPVVREAHTRLFPHLLVEGGVRITELAKVLGVTKQAVQPLVAELTELGLVRLEADPSDARARRVHLTDHGVAAMVHGPACCSGWRPRSRRSSPRATWPLKRSLAKLLPILERTTATHATDPAAPRPSPPGREPPGRGVRASRATASRARRGSDRRA